MAHGDNHAKRIVIEEAECLADKLQNGNAGCLETQGRAIALLVKMITPLYSAEFITVEECQKNHQGKERLRTTKIKVGPVSVEGPITVALITNSIPLICLGIVFFILGKGQGWW